MRIKLIVLMAMISCITFSDGIGKSEINFTFDAIIKNKNDVPFWVSSNTNGIIENNKTQNIGSFEFKQDSKFGKINTEYGFMVSNDFLEKDKESTQLDKAYILVDYGNVFFESGRNKDHFGINKNILSTGSMMVSENARAIPSVKLGVREYLKVPFTFDRLYFRGFISNGWLEKERYISNPMLHEKEIDLKIKVNENLNFSWAFRHDAIWGGKNPDGSKIPQTTIQDYIDVLVANHSADTAANEADRINTVGDHKGLYQLRGDYSDSNIAIGVYGEHFFEDNSGKKIIKQYEIMNKEKRFPRDIDGRAGIEINLKRNEKIESILFEYFNTKYQSGEETDTVGAGGRDNFYRNWMYGGWTYYDRVIGNPLIILNSKNGMVDGNNTHNRVNGINLGINGKICKNLSYRVNATFVKYYLSYDFIGLPENDKNKTIFENGIKQNYYLAEIKKESIFNTPLYAVIKIGYDNGELKRGIVGTDIKVGTTISF